LQLTRFADGTRRIVSISEVVGMEGDMVTMQDLFRHEIDSIDADGRIKGSLNSTGIMPTFAERFAKAGVVVESFIPAGGNWG
jgi:pilus assembly protein CpaF